MTSSDTNKNNQQARSSRLLCSENISSLKYCIIATFFWGLLAHAYCFLHTNFSHDSLNALYAGTIEEMWKIQLGRFLVPVYRAVTRGAFAVPWLIGLISLLFISISVYFVTEMFDIRSKGLTFAIAGIMTVNLTVTAIAATYIYELDIDMLALLLAVAAAYMWKKHSNVKGFALGVLFLWASMGLYQSYISVAISLIMFLSVFSLLNGSNAKQVIIHGLKGIGMTICSGILYFISYNAACLLTNTVLQERTNVFAFSGTSPFTYLWNTYAYWFKKILLPELTYPEYLIFAINVLLAVVVINAAIYIFLHSKLQIKEKILILILCLLMPLGMNITCLLSRNFIHDLMIYSFWLTYIMILLLAVWSDSQQRDYFSKHVKILTFVLTGLILWGNVLTANTSYIKKDLEQKSTLSLMTRVVTEMEAQEEYACGVTPIAFVGTSELYDVIPGFSRISGITGLNLTDAIGLDSAEYYYNAYKAYFKYILNYPINICDDSIHKKLCLSPEVQRMPSFPDKHCIKMIDGVMVIKMGNNSIDAYLE